MELINKKQILQSLESTEKNSLFIDPLLDKNEQVGEVSIDLRLGYDFLVSIFTRKPVVEVSSNNAHSFRGIDTFYQTTRRDLGDKFILYPNQCVLTTTLEYISVPNNYYLDLLSRSSYNRLGIQINTMVQPGFRGCIPIELYNHNNNAIELIVGSRVFQARFFELSECQSYTGNRGKRKYYGHIRPTPSKADLDKDIEKLATLININK